jgi:preprotein translocase subunit SecG
MHRRGLLLAVVALVGGTMQAWDSNVFAAPASIIVLVMIAVVLPAAALLTRSGVVRIGALVGAALLLVAARVSSPLTHNTLHMATLIAALCIFADWRLANPLRKDA